jgi:hypothetical protein
MRKLRPRVELHSLWEKARALATEQKRNVHAAHGFDALVRRGACCVGAVKRPSCKWKGQTVADEESTGRRG